jgi:hypothetical protein
MIGSVLFGNEKKRLEAKDIVGLAKKVNFQLVFKRGLRLVWKNTSQ